MREIFWYNKLLTCSLNKEIKGNVELDRRVYLPAIDEQGVS